MLLGEVLIAELLTIYRLAASALHGGVSHFHIPVLYNGRSAETHVATGEVPALKHELRDHTMEFGAAVAKALLASAKSTEIFGRLGCDVVIEVEVDPATLVCDDISRGSDAVRHLGLEDSLQWQRVG